MNIRSERSHGIHVVLAVGVVIVLAVLLGVRIGAHGARLPAAVPGSTAVTVQPAHLGPPSPATVPAPRVPLAARIEVPCWSCSESGKWPVRFRTDLDLLAPLGNGRENAALWFKDFAIPVGARHEEAAEAMGRRFVDPDGAGKVLPPDDPLLLEAEPWCDRGVMRFYPDFYAIEGYETQIPNLLLSLTFARSWLARGNDAVDPAAAMEDYRRIVRLGRLLRQEDTTIISDLVGLVCIRLGADGIYRRAIEVGDSDLAIIASIVLGEIAPQRLMTSARITDSEISDRVVRSWFGTVRLDVPDDTVDRLLRRARTEPDRRFRLEAMLTLNYIYHLDAAVRREKTGEVLEELARSDDPVTATTARWAIETEPNLKHLEK